MMVLASSREASDFGQRYERSSARGFIHKDDRSARALAKPAAEAP